MDSCKTSPVQSPRTLDWSRRPSLCRSVHVHSSHILYVPFRQAGGPSHLQTKTKIWSMNQPTWASRFFPLGNVVGQFPPISPSLAGLFGKFLLGQYSLWHQGLKSTTRLSFTADGLPSSMDREYFPTGASAGGVTERVTQPDFREDLASMLQVQGALVPTPHISTLVPKVHLVPLLGDGKRPLERIISVHKWHSFLFH